MKWLFRIALVVNILIALSIATLFVPRWNGPNGPSGPVLALFGQVPGSYPPYSGQFDGASVAVSAAASTDQALQYVFEPPGNLNVLNRTARVHFYGTTTSGASANGTWTIKLKICTAANFSAGACGTSITLGTFGPTGTQIASATSAPWDCDLLVSTTTTGTSGTFAAYGGTCHVETTSVTIQTDSPSFVVQTTANSSTIDLTQPLVWQDTFADSGASANNVITGRGMSRYFVVY